MPGWREEVISKIWGAWAAGILCCIQIPNYTLLSVSLVHGEMHNKVNNAHYSDSLGKLFAKLPLAAT